MTNLLPFPHAAASHALLVREARILFGPARARELWRALNLPPVPPGPLDEARACLRHLLAHVPAFASSRFTGPAPNLLQLIEAALDDDDDARLSLRFDGVRVIGPPGPDGFFVANRCAALRRLFHATAWADGRHVRVLRRLPEVRAARRNLKRGPAPPPATTFVPADLLDQGAL